MISPEVGRTQLLNMPGRARAQSPPSGDFQGIDATVERLYGILK